MSDRPPDATITFLGHSTVLLDLDGTRLLTDPVLTGRVGPLRRHAPTLAPDLLGRLDAILISHLHWDHLHLPSLRLLEPSTLLVVPRGARRALALRGFRNVEELEPDELLRIGGVELTGTFAEHTVRAPMAPWADSIGYLLRGSMTAYFAGDTDLFDEMSELSTVDAPLDLALIPVWGWGPRIGSGHLDPLRAAEALTLLRPRVCVPIHWGALYPVGLPWRRPHALVDAPRHFARHAADLAPQVEVVVLEPGASVEIVGGRRSLAPSVSA